MPQHDHISMALFCDFENVALGVRDANYEKFDIKRVLERLLLKGSIVVKKAYCDWERYKGFKAPMHEANFELIEIPHVRQSGKNSADIRLVVDALDLCYTKSHVNTFVIISGDSDFSPLVSKLRENAKHVIGVGVKQSTSDLLIANCDEFIYYDDLVRGTARKPGAGTQGGRDGGGNTRRSPEEDKRRREEMDARRSKAIEMAAETYDALVTDRDDGGRIWASVLKEAIKRRNPGFNENYYGFRTFGNLLEEALARGLLEFGRDEKSGTWVARGSGSSVPNAAGSTRPDQPGHAESSPTDADFDAGEPISNSVQESTENAQTDAAANALIAQQEVSAEEARGRRRSRGGRGRNKMEGRDHREPRAPRDAQSNGGEVAAPSEAPQAPAAPLSAPSSPAAAQLSDPVPAVKKTARKTAGRGGSARKAEAPSPDIDVAQVPSTGDGGRQPEVEAQPAKRAKAPARKSTRTRRDAKEA
jgi:uncharacterized LabA/DUF88 family protein